MTITAPLTSTAVINSASLPAAPVCISAACPMGSRIRTPKSSKASTSGPVRRISRTWTLPSSGSQTEAADRYPAQRPSAGLNYKASVKRHRLSNGKQLLIGALNASRRENQWLSVALAPGNSGLVQMRVTAPGGWGRRPEVDAPGGPRPTPGACPRCQLDPSHPQFVTRHRLPLNQARTRLRCAIRAATVGGPSRWIL